MRSPRSDPANVAEGAADPERAALGPIPQAMSAAENPIPIAPTDASADSSVDSPAEAEGRRTLSTAVVRMGPDRLLTVELRDGRVLVLRDVAMGPKDYRGVRMLAGAAGTKYRGRYADIAAARPGGGAAFAEPDFAVSNPLEATRGPAKRD